LGDYILRNKKMDPLQSEVVRLQTENSELRRQEGELLADIERLREGRERFRSVSEQVCYELKDMTKKRDTLAEVLLTVYPSLDDARDLAIAETTLKLTGKLL
jgi:predicted RNase H-like nuclease (RuvC/YqgF family)